MKLKYIKLITCAFLLFGFISGYAQEPDICVETQDQITDLNGNTTPASITITPNNLEYGEYVEIEVTSVPPNCGNFIGKSTNLYPGDVYDNMNGFLSGKCLGEFCFAITLFEFGEPCSTIEFCVNVTVCVWQEVINCPDCVAYVSLFCKGRRNSINLGGLNEDEGAVYLSGNTYLNNDGQVEEIHFSYFTALNDDAFSNISNKIYSTTGLVMDDILKKGASKYDISKQTEVITDDDYVFKYNSSGKIEWVWHKGVRDNKSKNYSFSESEILTNNVFFIESIYPNPFSKEISIAIESTKESSLNISIHDVLGSELFHTMKKISQGNNKFNVIPNISTSGMYLLKMTDDTGNVVSQKIFKN